MSIVQMKINRRNLLGMTLVELLIVVAVLTVTSYVTFLVYKPEKFTEKIEYEISELQTIIIALQTYESIKGSWPDNDNGCVDALGVLQSNSDNVSYIRGVNSNIYDINLSFSCEADDKKSSIYVSFTISDNYFNYMSRYVPSLEVLDNSNSNAIKVQTRILPISGTIKTYLSESNYGTNVVSVNSSGNQSSYKISEKYSFISMPNECVGADGISAGFISSALCPGFSLSSDRYKEVRIPVKIKVDYGIGNAEYDAEVVLKREVYYQGWVYESTPCKIGRSSLNCSNVDLENADGWRVYPVPKINIQFSAEYLFESSSINSKFVNIGSFDFNDKLSNQDVYNFFFKKTNLFDIYKDQIYSAVGSIPSLQTLSFNYSSIDFVYEIEGNSMFHYGGINKLFARCDIAEDKIYGIVSCKPN